MTITGNDIVSYRPSIGEYVNYENNNTVFDPYISSGIEEINRYLDNDGIIVSDIPDTDLNLKYLYLSYIVYIFYFLDKMSTDIENRQVIEELKSEYKKNYNIVIQKYKTDNSSNLVNNGISINYLG